MANTIYCYCEVIMDIKKYKNKHYDERCYILGNGPSLNEHNAIDLEDEIVFGTNRIYLSGLTPTYYVSVNPLVLEQYWDDIAEIDTIKFLPKHVEHGDNIKGEIIEIDTTLNSMAFSSPEGAMWEGHTVTYVCLQLAYYMGFKEVILLGVDHDFGNVSEPNVELEAHGADENHFHPDYFSDGAKWNAPDLPMSEIAYSLANGYYKKDGRRIINASAKTKLDVFELLPYNHVHTKGAWYPARVSAIVSAYYAKKYLWGCLEDLSDQTEDVEIIVVCEFGSDEHEMANHFRDSHFVERIKIVTTEDIPSVYRAWNIGIKNASGKYITNANTDDRHHKEALELMANILDGRPDIDLVYADSLVTWEDNQTFDEFGKLYPANTWKSGRWEGEPGYFAWYNYNKALLGRACFIGPQPMWRANLHQRHGYFLDNYQSAGDYEFWLRCAKDNNYLHLPWFLGLYQARNDGVELKNPVLNGQEAHRAIIMHQNSDGIEYFPHNNYIQIFLGGDWVIVEYDKLVEVVERLKNA